MRQFRDVTRPRILQYNEEDFPFQFLISYQAFKQHKYANNIYVSIYKERFTCKLVIRKKLDRNQNFDRKVVYIVLI